MSEPSKLSVEEVRELLTRAELCLNDGVSWAGPSIEMVAALCNHFLASQQPMMAWEFAGLAMSKTKWQHAYWSETNPNDPNAEFLLRCKTRAETWQRVQAMLLDLAREHDVTIVEPKK